MPGRNSVQRCTTASTFVRTIATSRAASARATAPVVLNPALLTSTSTVRPRLPTSFANASRDVSSVRSAATTSARTPCAFATSSARARSRSSRRATSVTPRPRPASWRAMSAPMPDDAPVTTHVPSGEGGGRAMARMLGRRRRRHRRSRRSDVGSSEPRLPVVMDFDLPPELDALRDEATALAREWTAHTPFPEDSWMVGHDAAFAKELGARGWIGMTWPREEGGHGRSVLERFIVFEALIANGAPVAAMWFADRQMGPTLLQFGTPDQRARWIPDIVAGTSMWCIGMSEPDAGSDVASLRTRAVRDGDDWIVDGQKVWTSGAAFA